MFIIKKNLLIVVSKTTFQNMGSFLGDGEKSCHIRWAKRGYWSESLCCPLFLFYMAMATWIWLGRGLKEGLTLPVLPHTTLLIWINPHPKKYLYATHNRIRTFIFYFLFVLLSYFLFISYLFYCLISSFPYKREKSLLIFFNQTIIKI